MKSSLASLSLLLAACTVGHMVGENENNQGAITCATTLCMGNTVCVDAQCLAPSGACGGFAGLQCPMGQRCVDDPRDNCDPNAGGADCGGVCVTPPANPPPQDAGTTGPQRCGGNGINPLNCPQGYRCVDDPNGCSMAVDCEGICEPDPNTAINCGGHVMNPVSCPSGYVCVDNPNHTPMSADGLGICIKRIECGTLTGQACPVGTTCIDDASDSCDPNVVSDCPAYCIINSGAGFCGGFGNLQCMSSGLRCVDDPGDGCDPLHGGADCGGVCVP